MNILLRILIAGLVLAAVLHPCAAETAELSITPHVDQRVELLSIVFRLAGNSEYNMNLLKGYTTDVDSYFSPYRNHPAVVIAKSLANSKG